MTRWVAFTALTLFLLVFLLVSARASERVVSDLAAESTHPLDDVDDSADHLVATRRSEWPHPQGGSQVSSIALLANVALSHAVFAGLLIVGIWLAAVPLWTLGVGTGVTGLAAIALGIGVGLAIALVNTLLGTVVDSDPSERLRSLLTPASGQGWALLLAVVLPIIAGFEELLFRATLIGAFGVAYDLSPWLLVAVSSIVFAAGHGAQGRIGIAVTGVLGVVLGAVFVTTESLLVVVVAHYVVNATEFVVVEGLDYDPFSS